MISVLIPILNEKPEVLIEVLHNLTRGIQPSSLEVILVNDGSINSDGSPLKLQDYPFPQRIRNYLTFVDNGSNFGVGYSFDRAAEIAQGDILVLQGCDVFPEKGWYHKVRDLVKGKEIGCACSVGLQPDNFDIHKEGMYRRYGAKILYTMTVDDLPKHSKLRKYPDYKDILESKWLPKLSDEPYEIPCVYGAFYWLAKDFYTQVHGFDTIKGQHYHGHSAWGCLEAMLSLKIRAYGGKCMMYPNIEAGHIFGRIGDDDMPRAQRLDLKMWNKLWTAHTLLDDELRDEVVTYLPPSLAYGMAQVEIKHHWDAVERTRERNKREGKLISKNC